MKVAARPDSSLPSATVNRTMTTRYQLTDMMARARGQAWPRYPFQIRHQPMGSRADTPRTPSAARARLLSGPADVDGALPWPPLSRLWKLCRVDCRNGWGWGTGGGAAPPSQPTAAAADSRARPPAQAAVRKLAVARAARLSSSKPTTSM